MDEMHPSSPQNSGNPWNKIIVNKIPLRFKGLQIDRENLISLFSQYGNIEHAYLCTTESVYPLKIEKVAVITFSKEEDARKVWEASQRSVMKFKDDPLTITLALDDYCPINDLPDICLSKISLQIILVNDNFNIESVCKRWKSVGIGSWSSVTTVKESWETIVSRRTESIRHVRLKIPEGVDDSEPGLDDSMKALSLIAEHLAHLESFVVAVYIDDASSLTSHFRSIISKNNQLKRLYLGWVHLDDGFGDVLPDGINEIQIESRDDKGSIGSGPVNVSRFVNLQVLALFNFTINKDQLQGIECLETLRVLKLKDSNVHPSNIEKIVNFRKLEHLAIPDCQISEVILEKILLNNKGLKHLDISDIQDITDSSFQHVSKLPHLQVLLMKNLDKVTDKHFTSMSNLKTLNCNGCSSITDASIQRLFTPDAMLQELFLCDSSVTLETLRAACEWTPPAEHKSLFIHLNEQLVREWDNSELKQTYNVSHNSRKAIIVVVRYSEDGLFSTTESDWLEIFDDSV